jgi:uncharacterized protein YqjF (DUF2071 family)
MEPDHMEPDHMEPEPVTAVAPRRVRPALLRQGWRDVAFLHWALDPAVAAPLLPEGTRPDVLDDRTFVGVVALENVRTRVLGGPPLPWLGRYGQVNVRLYSVDDQGRRGVVFLEQHAGRLVPTLAARSLAGLPYAWHPVRIERAPDRRSYTVGPPSGRGAARIDLRTGPSREADALELFVTARWGLHSRLAGRTVYTGLQHGPWELHRADLLAFDGDLLAAAGLPAVSGPPVSLLWSPGLDDARIGPVP